MGRRPTSAQFSAVLGPSVCAADKAGPHSASICLCSCAERNGRQHVQVYHHGLPNQMGEAGRSSSQRAAPPHPCSSTMALNLPRALACSHLSSPSLNPAMAARRGTPANIDMYAYIASVSESAAPGDDGSSSSSSPPPPWQKLELDSDTSVHMVGDPRLLSVLRDAPATRWPL